MINHFDEKNYLDANPDVKKAVSEKQFSSGLEHWESYGKMEGRSLSAQEPNLRELKVFTMLNKNGRGLEIGPSHNPIAPKSKGFNVQILDHADADELRSKYKNHDVNVGNIEEVDFVWRGEKYCDLIGEKNCFDFIIASHVIEHVPDLISYLQQCEELINDSGLISLVIPDRRYCFDYFMPSTTTGCVLDAFEAKRKKPSSGQVFDHFANASKYKNTIAWSKTENKGPTTLMHDVLQANEFRKISALDLDYIDVHCWRFTPTSFRLLISDLNQIGYSNLEIKTEFDTSGCEFYVTLGRGVTKQLNRFEILKKIQEGN